MSRVFPSAILPHWDRYSSFISFIRNAQGALHLPNYRFCGNREQTIEAIAQEYSLELRKKKRNQPTLIDIQTFYTAGAFCSHRQILKFSLEIEWDGYSRRTSFKYDTLDLDQPHPTFFPNIFLPSPGELISSTVGFLTPYLIHLRLCRKTSNGFFALPRPTRQLTLKDMSRVNHRVSNKC